MAYTMSGLLGAVSTGLLERERERESTQNMPRGTMANSTALPLYDDFERLKYHSVALGASGTGSGSSRNNSLRVVIDHRAAAQLVFRRRSSISSCSMTVV